MSNLFFNTFFKFIKKNSFKVIYIIKFINIIKNEKFVNLKNMWKKKFTLRVPLTFKINRTKIDLYFDCKRCFFRLKVWNKKTHGTPLALNNKVVQKLKSELNICREKQNTSTNT